MFKVKSLLLVVLALFIFLAGADAAIQWPVADGGNDHYYEAIVEPGITWFEAKAAAELRGGYLVTILSQEENAFLFDKFVRQPQYWVLGFDPPYEGQAAGPWIGAYQESSTNPSQGWQWLNNDGPLVYQNWLPYEPNNYQGAGEYAALFYDNDSSDSPTITSQWNDWSPNNETTSYIVEYNHLPTIVGKWGYVVLEHWNNGQWGTTSGTTVFNDDGTGTDTYKSNDGGILTSKTKNFTYTVTANSDGSFTITLTGDETETLKVVLSDDGKMLIEDSTAETSEQGIMVAIKMDPSKTCTNADFNGDYYALAYHYEYYPPIPPPHYKAWSGIGSADGIGNILKTSTENDNGTITNSSLADTYHINPDCSGSFSSYFASLGYLSGDGKLFVSSEPLSIYDWDAILGMKKGDKTYSNSDLAGTWALVGFGDENNGSSFNAEFVTMTCDSNGNCASSTKVQKDGSVFYETEGHTFTVREDGSFGDSTIPYANAIGNNGNTIIVNERSFRQDELQDREIMIGVRCSGCSNLAGEKIPMINVYEDPSGEAMFNLYLYDPVCGCIKQITTTPVDGESFPSLNPDQTKLVYTAEESGYTYSIYVYDTETEVTTNIATATNTDSAAYFDEDGKILFLDGGVLKKMNPDGTNITTVATPESLYSFEVFFMSPDRQKIIAVEEKQEGSSYRTGHYARLVLMNADGTNRTIIKGEYLGDWNMLSWKPNSSKVFYYYHVFDVVGGVYQGKIPKYALIDIPSGTETDLSNSDVGMKEDGSPKEENACLFTKSGNLLSFFMYHELYNGQTGALIAVRSDVPSIMESMWGWDSAGEIYFADLDGTNFRRFIEEILTVNKAGTGSGTVTSSPVGIDCGTDCAENYSYGTVVTLTATPLTGSVFAGWSGDADCSDGVVTMTASKDLHSDI